MTDTSAAHTRLEWFPMRVTYSREERMKQQLDDEGIENFLPMRVEYDRTDDWNIRRRLVPAIHGLIFVHSTQERLTGLKRTVASFEPLRYISDHTSPDHSNRILRVPDRQMENFIRVATVGGERLEYLEPGDYLLRPGRRVLITDGDFRGAEGVIKRIKKRQCVVVQVEGVAAVAITFVPAAWLQNID